MFMAIVHFIINCFYRNLLQLLYCIWLCVSLVLYIHCIYGIYIAYVDISTFIVECRSCSVIARGQFLYEILNPTVF